MTTKQKIAVLSALAAAMVTAIWWEAAKNGETLSRISQKSIGDAIFTAFKVAAVPAIVAFCRRRSLPSAVRDCMMKPGAITLLSLDPGSNIRVFDPSYRPADHGAANTFRGVRVLQEVQVCDPGTRAGIQAAINEEISWESEFRQCVNPRLVMRFTRGERVAELLFGSDWECLMVFLDGHHMTTCATTPRNLSRIPVLLEKAGVVLADPPRALFPA